MDHVAELDFGQTRTTEAADHDDAGPVAAGGSAALIKAIIAAVRTVFDPEIPVNVYDLGLIYRIDTSTPKSVEIDMTLTAPGCPVAGEMVSWVKKAASEVEGIGEVTVNLVFDPPWDKSRMSEEAQLELGLVGMV